MPTTTIHCAVCNEPAGTTGSMTGLVHRHGPTTHAFQPETQAMRIDRLTEATSDAYSFDRYASWRGCVALLVRRGYSDHEVEAILRSKWMRWAADGADRPYGRATSTHLAHSLDNGLSRTEVADLVAGTFPQGGA